MIEVRAYRNEDYEDVKINLQEGGLFNDSVDNKETLLSGLAKAIVKMNNVKMVSFVFMFL